VLENSVGSKAKLPESDIAEMEVFLNNIYQLLPVLGIDHMRPVVEQIAGDEDLLYNSIKGLEAKGKRTTNGFIVFRGSEAILEHRQSAAKEIKARRDKLQEDGILKVKGDHLVFTKDVEFSSPSAAGGIVRGGNTAGPLAWKNAQGISLKQLEETL